MLNHPLRILVVDDEAPARCRLRELLMRTSDIGTIDEVSDGRTAIEAIRRTLPDLVFLDVQMPELDGLGVIDSIGAARMPPTIFVTAYGQHALRAFEANALDYLLKPFSDERFEGTVARARARFESMRAADLATRMMGLLAQADGALDRLAVKADGATTLLRMAELDWIQAAGVYVSLHTRGKEYLYRCSLADLERRFDRRHFVRVHRSTIVNLNRIQKLEPISHGEFSLVLSNGTRLRLSRSYRAELEKCLGQPL